LYKDALHYRSFYFALMAILYSYIAVSCLAQPVISKIDNSIVSLYAMLIYIIFLAITFIFILRRLNKKLKAS